MLDDAARSGYDGLHLQISGDDPNILAWPWEALRDPKTGVFAHLCQIERRLNAQLDPLPVSEKLPQERINILLVTARPYEKDVHYRSVSRLLVELIEEQKFPADIHLLRPPTFDSLRDHLRANSNFYHILHFDGHGAYGRQCAEGDSGFTFRGHEGCLVFEKDDGASDAIRAEQLSALLREHAVPAVVLNACQSGAIDEHAEDAFASVATALLQAGVRSVVAMAYSLYVSGAQVFLPAFYRRLFESGSVAEAARFGRQQMFAHPERVCVRGKHPLQDWLVPVVYQQDPLDFSFVQQNDRQPQPSESGKKKDAAMLPPEIRDEENPYGFIGRDGPLLELERAMRRKPAGILVHGLGGVGKTTLARGFVEWLHATRGLGNGCFWFTFSDVRSAEFVLNRLGEALFGGNFSLAPLNRRLEALSQSLKEHPFVIVWDNFEVVRGIPGTEVRPILAERDQDLLLKFLRKLRGGRSKVIITSRSEEDWLGAERFKIGISGLVGEERWLYMEEILGDLGVKIDREDPEMVRLVELLGGHPLCMRVILPMLEKERAADVIKAVQSGMDAFQKEGDEVNARFYGTLEHARTALPEALRPLLVPLGMHERFLALNLLESMAQQVSPEWTRDTLSRFASTLVRMGLLVDRGQGIYELHPALTGYLRTAVLPASPDSERDGWAMAFVEVMGSLADHLAPKEPHEQRMPFHLFGASFHYAMTEAERLGMSPYFTAILQSLAVFAQNTMNYPEARHLFEQLAAAHQKSGFLEGEAAAYHQLGIIAEEQRDFESAEKWYRKSLAISEKQGYEHGAASTYHQLGVIAAEQRDFESAEKWYRKSLAISEKQGNEHGAASTYHQLGMIAQEQRDFGSAEKWYRKSLAIKEKQGNEHGAAMTYGQLGILAGLQENYEEAEHWLIKSILAFLNCNSPEAAQLGAHNFIIFYKKATPDIRAKLKAMWQEAGLPKLPES
jgi:tetratricopeptide (TPR) repeat protein